jgi:hypothetical protein
MPFINDHLDNLEGVATIVAFWRTEENGENEHRNTLYIGGNAGQSFAEYSGFTFTINRVLGPRLTEMPLPSEEREHYWSLPLHEFMHVLEKNALANGNIVPFVDLVNQYRFPILFSPPGGLGTGATRTNFYANMLTGGITGYPDPNRELGGRAFRGPYSEEYGGLRPEDFLRNRYDTIQTVYELRVPAGQSLQAPGFVASPVTNAVADHDTLTLDPVPAPTNGQVVLYGVSMRNNPNTVPRWQTSPVFEFLFADTDHYVFTKTQQTVDIEQGPISQAFVIRTAPAPAEELEIEEVDTVDFETEAYGME